MEDINLQLIPYKNKGKIQKYHIINTNDKQLKYRICNVYAPFGRQTSNDHKTSTKITQHRLNVCFNKLDIENNNKSYLELKRLITELETYFGSFDELKQMNLTSNIIDRDEYGIVIRFHLKTLNDKTITPLIRMINTKDEETEWIQFDKNKQFNFDFHPDCLWIDKENNKYGISLMIDKVFQFIS